jgi:hypothetical protein
MFSHSLLQDFPDARIGEFRSDDEVNTTLLLSGENKSLMSGSMPLTLNFEPDFSGGKRLLFAPRS